MKATVDSREPARVRITFDIDKELRREVKLEAVRRGVTVREYVTYLILRERETGKTQK